MTARSQCYRVSGGGNDFLALIEPATPPTGEQIRAWCTRGLSLGADGLFVLERSAEGVRMVHFNADGRPAALCLNGTRCAVRLAEHVGWHDGTTSVETGAGTVTGTVSGDRVRLQVPAPCGSPRAQVLEVDGTAHEGWFLDVGVPQFVLPMETSLNEAPVASLGPALRHHPDLGPAGANVMFVRFLPPSRIEIRSYERGVEAETLACGTGVLAAAAVALAQSALEPPVIALTAGGFELEVDVQSDGKTMRWHLTGDARLLAQVEPTVDSERLPDPPVWT